MTRRLVVATGNAGKLTEMRALLSEVNVELVTQNELGVEEAEENGLSFVENSLIKARNAAAHTGLPAIADDSGIVVDALDGAPGIYSARYAGEHGNDEANNTKLVAALSGVPRDQRTARFWCAAVYVDFADDPCPVIVQDSWEGHIADAPRGDGGFGYDPLFVVAGDDRTAAQYTKDEKNRVSHRGKAVTALTAQLRRRFDGVS